MIMRTNADCTVYNKYQGNWVFSHLYGVFWDEVKGINTLKSGLQNADSLTLYIPFKVTCSKEYQDPKQYDGTGWTLQKGDIVVKGIVTDEIKSITDLEQKYGSVHSITSIDKLDFGSANMRHFEIGGK